MGTLGAAACRGKGARPGASRACHTTCPAYADVQPSATAALVAATRRCPVQPRQRATATRPWRPLCTRLPPLAASASDSDADTELDDDESEACFASSIRTSTTLDDRFTVLDIEAQEYPGLIRVISWLLNGLELIVQNAVLKTDDEGIAVHTYWLTDSRGRKLKDASAEMLRERLRDFINVCKPTRRTLECRAWRKDHVTLSNVAHPTWTQVTVNGEPNGNRPGFLLELSSVITGVGLTIHEAVIQGCDAALPQHGAAAVLGARYDVRSAGRTFIFYVTDARGTKLDYTRATALLYTISIVCGSSNGPLVVPELDVALATTDCE